MKHLQDDQARQISGGRWKCKLCGKKFWTIGAFAHWGNKHGVSKSWKNTFKFCL